MFRRPKSSPRETLFFAVDAPAHDLYETLSTCTDPHYRADLLKALAYVELAKAALHQPTFGPDPIEHENGRDLAEATWWSGQLLLKLAEAEEAHANHQPRPKPRWSWQQGPLEKSAAHWLDKIASRTDDTHIRLYINNLYLTVRPLVGGQAAEVVSSWLYGIPDNAEAVA